MGIKIVAHGYLGTLKRQEMSTNDYTSTLSSILNSGGILAPVTIEKNKIFSYWGATIDSYDIGKYSINQLIGLGFVTENNILNIYANYSYMANNVQITLNANGGAFPDGSTSKVITTSMGSIYGELESNISVLPTKSGSYFLKWTDPKNNTVNGSYEFTESVVITAQYSASQNSSVSVKDSRGKSVIAGSYPKSTLWKDLYAQAISNGYSPSDIKKVFSKIVPGYGSYTGQTIKSIDFSVANNPMKIGWLRGSIYEAANADVSLYTNRNLLVNSKFSLKNKYDAETSSPYFKQSVTPDFYSGKKITGSVNVKFTNIKSLVEAGFHRLVLAIQFRDESGKSRYFDISKNISVIGDSFEGRISNTIDLSGMRVSSIPVANLYIQGITADYLEISDPKLEEGTTATPYTQAPEDINKKIRNFSATTVPVDPSTTFAVTGKATNNIALTHNPIGNDEYLTNRNYIVDGGFESGNGRGINTMPQTPSYPEPFGKYMGCLYDNDSPGGSDLSVRYTLATPVKILANEKWTISYYYSIAGSAYGQASDYMYDDAGDVYFSILLDHQDHVTEGGQGVWKRFSNTFSIPKDTTITQLRFGFIKTDSSAGWKVVDNIKLEKGSTATPYTQAPEETKPGLWINNDWLYNPYTQKWLDTPIDNAEYSYSNSVITFKNYFNVQYVTGDISKVRSSVTATVKSVVSGYGSTTDKKPLYNNSYFPSDDSGVTLNVEEYLGYSYIVFYNPVTGYSQTIYKQAGTPYSEFLKGITRSKFEAANKYLKGFYIPNYWESAKLIDSNPINSPIDMAKSDYLLQIASSFTTVFFNANGGLFYPGTSNQTDQIKMNVQNDDTYSIISNFAPPIAKRTMSLLYWARNLTDMEPAYPFKVVDGSTIYSKWTVQGGTELKRKPREFYLIDADTIFNGWDMMDKYSISEKNNIFVIDPTGIGTAFSNDITSSLDGWGNTKRQIESNNIEFDAYYNGYDQYNKLGAWLRGKRLLLAMLNETNSPTYWGIQLENIERTEIKYGTDMLKGKLSFKKISPAFDLEFIGIGTDNIIDNADDMFRRNAYVYIHSMKIPDVDTGIQIMANDGTKVIQDSVAVSLPAGSYFEYSTIPFKEAWRYGDSWTNMPNNLYNNIIDLVTSKSLKLGIGKWDITVSSSTKVIINSLKPNTIGYYKGKTIDSLGGIGPFTGIAIKEKEL